MTQDKSHSNETGAVLGAEAKTRFAEIVKAGNPAALKELLESGLSASAVFSDTDGQWSLLHCCAATGRAELCQVLIDAGADVKVLSSRGSGRKSVADVALGNGHEELAGILLEAGSKITRPMARNPGDVLSRAAYRGDDKRVRWALKNGADINAFDRNNRTALHYAAEQGHMGTVRLLVRKGADINAFDPKTGHNPMMIADKSGHEKVAEYLKGKGSRVSVLDVAIRASVRTARIARGTIPLPAGAEALRMTARKRSRKARNDLGALLKAGVNPNAANERGETPLMMACRGNNRAAVKILLGAGADLHLRDKLGRSAYDYARDRKNRLLSRFLGARMRSGASPSSVKPAAYPSSRPEPVHKVPAAYQPPAEAVEEAFNDGETAEAEPLKAEEIEIYSDPGAGVEVHRRNGRIVASVLRHSDGRVEWRKEGKLHREDGPAIIRPDGREEWYQNGLLHREDGPAIINADGSKEWWKKGSKADPAKVSQPSPLQPKPAASKALNFNAEW